MPYHYIAFISRVFQIDLVGWLIGSLPACLSASLPACLSLCLFFRLSACPVRLHYLDHVTINITAIILRCKLMSNLFDIHIVQRDVLLGDVKLRDQLIAD